MCIGVPLKNFLKRMDANQVLQYRNFKIAPSYTSLPKT